MAHGNFWELETPISANTGMNVLYFYPKAGKLSVQKRMWSDERGEKHQGKSVVVDVAAVKNCPEAVALLKQALF